VPVSVSMNNPLGRKYILKCQAVSGAIFNFREIVDRYA